MPRKKQTFTFSQKMLKLYGSGLPKSPPKIAVEESDDSMLSLESRIERIFGFVKRKHDKSRMLFFVMYDIEDDKVRNQIVKYLLRKGCFRVQKSIFLADLEHEAYQEIRSDLTEVQACYENNDSILVVPISTDYLQAMRIIGKNINIDLILKNKNTLFF